MRTRNAIGDEAYRQGFFGGAVTVIVLDVIAALLIWWLR